MHIKYIKNHSYENLIFVFLFYHLLTARLDRNALAKKIIVIFFQLECFVDRTSFHSHSLIKINDFVTTQYAITIFLSIFYLNP